MPTFFLLNDDWYIYSSLHHSYPWLAIISTKRCVDILKNIMTKENQLTLKTPSLSSEFSRYQDMNAENKSLCTIGNNVVQ